jgi:hypothetical protein
VTGFRLREAHRRQCEHEELLRIHHASDAQSILYVQKKGRSAHQRAQFAWWPTDAFVRQTDGLFVIIILFIYLFIIFFFYFFF